MGSDLPQTGVASADVKHVKVGKPDDISLVLNICKVHAVLIQDSPGKSRVRWFT